MRPERRQINRRAVLRMMRLVRTLIALLLVMLREIVFLALFAAMSIVVSTIWTGGIWKRGCFVPMLYHYRRVARLQLLSDLCRRGLIGLYAAIQRARIYHLHGRSQEIRSQQAQEPQTISTGVAVEGSEQNELESGEELETKISRPSHDEVHRAHRRPARFHVERQREELRRPEEELLSKMKAGGKNQKEKIKKGRKEEEEKK